MTEVESRRSIRLRGKGRSLYRRLRIGAATVLTAALALSGAVLGVQVAQAATAGPGYGTWDDEVGWQGAFVAPNGTYVYCIEPGVTNPSGTTTDGGLQSNVTSYSPYGNRVIPANDLARINRVVTEYGQTQDNVQASAVSFVVKYVANPDAMFASHIYSGPHNIGDYIRWVLYYTVDNSTLEAIVTRANQILAATAGTTAGSGTGGSGTLDFVVDPLDNYKGTVKMTGTASTGTIVLTNGVFAATNSNTMAGAQSGVAYAVKGVPPTDDGAPYKISGTGTFSFTGSGYNGNVRIWNTQGQQVTAGAGTKAPTSFNVQGNDPMVRGTQFLPVVQTTATTFIQKGQPFEDELVFSTIADSNGLNNPWYQSPRTGRYIPVTFNGTVYGPFAEQPAESPTVPADAPVAATLTVTTDPVTGPTVPYLVQSTEVSDAAGHYTYVWSVDWNDQIPAAQAQIPGPSVGNEDQEPYYWQDAFGQVVETSVTPMTITATTQVKTPEVPLNGTPGDTAAIVNEDSLWLQVDGAPIPVTINWDAYFDPGTEEVPQVPASEIPAEAVHLGRYTTTVTEPSNIETPDDADALGFTAPASAPDGGFIVWVLSINADENDGFVASFSDDYGVPSEIQQVALPTIRTESQPSGTLGESITDTAIVEGTLPDNGAMLAFETYRVPMIEVDGVWMINGPEGTVAGDLSWVCTEENRVFSNVGEGQVIIEPGSYVSPEVPTDEFAQYLWVESITSIPNTPEGQPELIARGECGIPNESTVIIEVTTQAQTSDAKSTTPTLSDNAIVTGFVPEDSTIVFNAYRGETGKAPVCDESTLIWTSKDIALEPGLFPEGTAPINSGSFVAEEWSTESNVYFIETTKDELGRVISQGECGEPDETVKVASPPLAFTGGDSASTGWVFGGAALVLVAGVALTATAAVRRRNAVQIAE